MKKNDIKMVKLNSQMNYKFFFLRCFCATIILFIFTNCDSKLEKVAKMENMILSFHNEGDNNEDDYFTSDFSADIIEILKNKRWHYHYGGDNLDSIAYIGHNWFRLTFEYYGICYWKIVEEDNEFKLDNITNAYSECISQINDLSYVDRIKFKFNSIKYDDVQSYFQGSLCKVGIKDKFGLINLEGKEIIPCIYDDVAFLWGDISETNKESLFRTDCQDDLLRVKLNNKFGLINLGGKEFIPCKYDELTIFDWNERLLQVKLDNKYGLINLEGEEIIPCKYDEFAKFGWKEKSAATFLEKLLQVKLDDKYGLINLGKNEIIPCKYDELTIFNWNSKSFFEEDKDSLYAATTEMNIQSLKIVLEIDKILVKLDDKYGLINLEDKEIIPCRYDSIGKCHYTGGAKVKLDNKYGFFNPEGREIIPCKYDSIGYYWPWDCAKVKLDNKYGLFDFEGRAIIPYLFEYISKEDGELQKVRKEDLWSYYKKDGTQVTEFYEDVVYYSDLDHPIFAAKSNGKWGYLNEAGDVLISFKLDSAGEPGYSGTALVQYNGHLRLLELYTGRFLEVDRGHYNSGSSNSANNSIIRKVCPTCSGTGKMEIRGGGIVLDTQQCPSCGGLGYVRVPALGW